VTGSGNEAVDRAKTLKPDVVVMDVTMPELNGIEATRRIRESCLHVRVLALSVHREPVCVREVLRAGAEGYLLKEPADTDPLAAVRAVAEGHNYLSPEVSGAILEDFRKHVTNPVDLLTPREREVLQLIAEGKTDKDILGLVD
jgi:DNA-binding NarL/FixJ family response regulator